MRLTLRQLQIFKEVALCGSTSAAAANVPLSQSATSAALNELERLLGVSLFDRVGKRLLLNDTGRTLLPAALAVLDGAHTIEVTFGAGQAPGVADLHLFASTTIGNYLLPAVLARYRESYPRLRFDVHIGNTADVIAAVRDFTTDVGFIEGPCHEPDVTLLSWRDDELVIVAAPSHPLVRAAAHRRLSALQLTSTTWLFREAGSGTREAVEQVLLPHLRGIDSTITLGSSEAIKTGAAEGMGVSCLSLAAVQDLVDAKRLVVLPTSLPRLTRGLSLIHHRSKLLSASLRDFVAFCLQPANSAAG
jgi:DNA-binding transcriptional LysR family regulator